MHLPVKGYEGLYEVTYSGFVYSIAKQHYLTPKKRGEYLAVQLSDTNKKRKFHSIHRLVAEAFVPNPDNKPQVNHLDEDKKNNRAHNLDWVTAHENQVHSKSLTWVFWAPWDDEVAIKGLNAFAKQYNLSTQCLQRLKNGTQYQHKGWRLLSIY